MGRCVPAMVGWDRIILKLPSNPNHSVILGSSWITSSFHILIFVFAPDSVGICTFSLPASGRGEQEMEKFLLQTLSSNSRHRTTKECFRHGLFLIFLLQYLFMFYQILTLWLRSVKPGLEPYPCSIPASGSYFSLLYTLTPCLI